MKIRPCLLNSKSLQAGAIALCLLPAIVLARTVMVQVGSVDIALPMLEGYRALLESEERWAMAASTTPATNRLLAVLVPARDSRTGESRYVMVQTVRALEKVRTSARQ